MREKTIIGIKSSHKTWIINPIRYPIIKSSKQRMLIVNTKLLTKLYVGFFTLVLVYLSLELTKKGNEYVSVSS